MKYKTLDEAGLKPLREHLDLHIDKIHAHDADRDEHVHVTELTSQCPVGVYLKKRGEVTPDMNASKLRRFEVGHKIEDLAREALHEQIDHALQERFRANGFVIPSLNLKGTPDIPLRGSPYEMVEVKSIHPFALDAMAGRPHDHYVEQLNFYLGEAKKATKMEWIGRLFYLSLDGRTMEFIIEFDQALYDLTLAKATTMRDCLANETAPEPLPTFVEEVNKKGETVTRLNWKVQYCIGDGIHEYCEALLAGKPFPTTPMTDEERKRWIGRLEYKAKKATEEGKKIDKELAEASLEAAAPFDGILKTINPS